MASQFTMNKKITHEIEVMIRNSSQFSSPLELQKKNTPIKITIPQYVINSIKRQGSIQNPLDLIFLKIG